MGRLSGEQLVGNCVNQTSSSSFMGCAIGYGVDVYSNVLDGIGLLVLSTYLDGREKTSR
jgi:hypothetical protein